jgi:hypothetical protein
MDKVQKHNSFNTNTPLSESYKNYAKLTYLDTKMRMGRGRIMQIKVAVPLSFCSTTWQGKGQNEDINFTEN